MLPGYPTAIEANINAADLVVEGNINLRTRPVSLLKNGKIEEIFSFVSESKLSDKTIIYVLIPKVTDDGQKLTDKQAIDLFNQTNRHFGKFAKRALAERYRGVLHRFEIAILKEEIKNRFSTGDAFVKITDIADDTKRNLSGVVQLADLAGAEAEYFGSNVLEVGVDYKMDIGSEITIKILDPQYTMSELNYFVLRRDIIYRGLKYEIAGVDTGPGEGYSPVVTILARNKGIMQMKRDKTPRTVNSGGTAYSYAEAAAKKFGMNFLGQKTNPVQSVFKSGGSNLTDSTWDVLKRIAGENQYVIFEINNTLVFGSHTWLMWQFGTWTMTVPKTATKPAKVKSFIPLLYIPGLTGSEIANLYVNADTQDAAFEVEKWHTFGTDEADPLAAQGSCNVLMPNGALLRPGMTALCGPYPDYFKGGYIITSVSFSEGSPNSAQVGFRTPEEPKNQQGLPINPRTGTKAPSIPAPPYSNKTV